ncbi:hypothetical protein [Marinomonas shanghaiensis]|uniref:hypothetical protein n=1 Tax=Marinomonas shanghaiensis TaxID=2202418 RepID=UPI000DB99A24|nr:hypothetical protein [Marinomonas shanghaiensis]
MAHFIEIDGIREKLYLLIQMALAAESFTSRYGIGVENVERFISKEQYWRHTKSTVSNYSLEIAVKLRNAIELLESNGISFTLDSSVHIYNSGIKADGTKEQKDIKYIFHKIIHAKSFQIDAIGSYRKHESLLWWAGTLTLSGTEHRKTDKAWCFFFNIFEWCQASLDFLAQVEVHLQKIQLNSEDLVLRKIS